MPWVNDHVVPGAMLFDAVAPPVGPPYCSVIAYDWSAGGVTNPSAVTINTLVTLRATIRNDGQQAGDCRVIFRNYAAGDVIVATSAAATALAPGAQQTVSATITPTTPQVYDLAIVGQHFEA